MQLSHHANQSTQIDGSRIENLEGKNVLVTGITGSQGEAVAKALLQRKAHVSGGLSPKNINKSRILKDVNYVPIDFSHPGGLGEAFKHAEIVALTFPVTFDRKRLLEYASNVSQAAQEAGVRQVIYNASSPVCNYVTGNYSIDVKSEIISIIKSYRLPLVVLKPTVYLENLVAPWSIDKLRTQGVLEYPIQRNIKISWTSMRDVGEFIASVINNKIIEGEFNVGSALTTGQEIAEELSRQARRSIKYISIDTEQFEKQLGVLYDAVTAKGIADNYRYLNRNPAIFQYNNQQEFASFLDTFPLSIQRWVATVVDALKG